MRALAMTGIVTASWISRILSGSAIRATPPSRRMSAGTRSSAMTATAPASSAIRACSAVVTSMITPPFSISARPLLTRIVPIWLIKTILAALLQAAEDALQLSRRRRDLPDEHGVVLRLEHVVDVLTALGRAECVVGAHERRRAGRILGEVDRDVVPGFRRTQGAFGRGRLDHPELLGIRVDRVAQLGQARRGRLDRVVRMNGVSAGRHERGQQE